MCIREKSFSRLCDQVELEEQKAGRGRYFDSAEQARLIEYSKKNLNLGSFAKELGITSYLARSLIINSVIRGVQPDIKRRIRDWRISRDDIESFKSSISAGSSNLVGNTITIRKSLKLVLPKGVSLSGILTSVLNGSLTYDYCHHDCILDIKVSQENLNSLLSHEIRASNTTSNLLSVAEAATAIGISSKMVHALVKKQLIITYEAPGHHHDDVKGFRFTTRELGKFKHAREHTPVLLSLRAAAHQLDIDRSWLRKQILEKTALTLYRLKDYVGEIFLSEKEVLQWSSFLDKTLTGPELARAVGVTRNTVFKWRKSGRLRAVSGPGINGFGCYRYHKREVARFMKCM
jgi:plasmid maintenance system antidote protein VapI